MPKVAIIGTTSWGITLGWILAQKGLSVGLWARSAAEAQELRHSGFHSSGNRSFEIPCQEVPRTLAVTENLSEAAGSARAVILAVTSQTMRQNVRTIKPHVIPSMIIASAAKGIELGTNKRMSQVIGEELGPAYSRNTCVISGPNLAREISRGLPAATVVASENEEASRTLQKLLTTPRLCVFTHTDVIGVELGGALKNIIALGAGMADGLGYGDNAKAAFITRGLTEIAALGVAVGANPLTFSGLAGLGDVVATCASPLSRNHYFGVELAKGRSMDEILAGMDEVAEGVPTTKVAWEMAQKMGLEMPITGRIYRVLYGKLSPEEAAAELMGTPVNHELTGRRWRLFSFFRRQKRS